MAKIYCSKCMYFHLIDKTCNHPKNRKIKWFKEDWYGPKRSENIGYINSPEELNRNNDCELFEVYQ